MQFLKTVIWCGQIIGYSLDINVIDIKANQIKEKLEVECPELIKNYNFNFIEADIESEKAVNELEKLKYINYILVALNTDEVNIREAIFLRRFFICQDKEKFERKPIINLWIEDEEKNKQVDILKNEKNTQYDFNAFGSSYQLYCEKSIINSNIEKIAQQIHLSWNPNDTLLREYYKNEYNVRSSRAAATHIKYKMYSVLKENYTGNKEYDIKSFEEIIKDENVLRALAQNEHNRWNAYMRSDGFKKAEIKDVEKYHQSIGDYKNHLAKLHPAIVDNEELKDVEKELGKNLIGIDEDMIKSISNYLNIKEEKTMEYNPKPISTNDVILNDEILELAEVLAKNTHDIWARGRMKQGWKYGEYRNDNLKTTPCLVPYEELPESEKEYDRNTAIETLKLIKKLGFKITRG